MKQFKVIIEYRNGKKIELNNVEQMNKYDIFGDITIKLSIPTKEIKSCYADFSKVGTDDGRRIKDD